MTTPGEILDLKNWYLTLPTGPAGSPDTIHQPELDVFSDEYFNVQDGAVYFKANCGGVTTKGSTYPRSELRETNGKALASWDMKSGTHTMTYAVSVEHLPTKKPQVVVGQIHNDKDDVIEIRLTGPLLEVIHNTIHYGALDSKYTLGKKVTITIVASGGKITVSCGTTKVGLKATSKGGNYFKIGCYTQSNVAHGDKGDDFGAVKLYSVKVVHSK